ncbi:hypothetical protein UNDYM_4388 [Undibacterium sp. YM2]|nr:hypothetical protein UNDYM_4388 [Undibacterium sp. YM2]
MMQGMTASTFNSFSKLGGMAFLMFSTTLLINALLPGSFMSYSCKTDMQA